MGGVEIYIHTYLKIGVPRGAFQRLFTIKSKTNYRVKVSKLMQTNYDAID